MILLIFAAFYFVSRPNEIQINTIATIKRTLPKNAFTQLKEAYDEWGGSILNLKFYPMTMQLPDLRKYLIYYGKNDRPDAKDAQPVLHLAFTGNKTVTSASPGEKIYVLYDRHVNPPQYVFSTDRTETPLWIEATAIDKEAHIKVSMRNDNGQMIQEPWAHAQFVIPQREYVRTGTPWEIGKFRVDESLLAGKRRAGMGLIVFWKTMGAKNIVKSLANNV